MALPAESERFSCRAANSRRTVEAQHFYWGPRKVNFALPSAPTANTDQVPYWYSHSLPPSVVAEPQHVQTTPASLEPQDWNVNSWPGSAVAVRVDEPKSAASHWDDSYFEHQDSSARRIFEGEGVHATFLFEQGPRSSNLGVGAMRPGL